MMKYVKGAIVSPCVRYSIFILRFFLPFIFIFNCISVSAAFESPLEIVVVSGTKAEAVQGELPHSVSLIGRQELQNIKAQHPNEFAQSIPGVWVSRGDGQEHLTAIRSPVFTGPGACGNFVIAEDGLAVRSAGFCNTNQLFDTFYENARGIESFRGANSALFGSNAMYGGFNILSPDFNRDSDFSMSMSSYDHYAISWNASFAQNVFYGSLIDNAMSSSRNRFREEAGYRQQKFAYKNASHIADWDVISQIQFNQLEQETAGFIEGKDSYRDRERARLNANPEAYRDVQSIRANTQFKYRFNSGDLLEIQPYIRKHSMNFAMHFLPWKPIESNSHDAGGINVKYINQLAKSVELIAGIETEFTKGMLNETQNSPAPFAIERFPQGIHYNYGVDAKSLAVYGLFKFQATDSLSLYLDLRADSIDYDYKNHETDGYTCGQGVTACRFYRPNSKTDKFDFISYRLAANYSFVQRKNAYLISYANMGLSFRAPQTSELYRLQYEVRQSNNNALQEVSLASHELGLRFGYNKFRAHIAYFDMFKENGIYQNSNREYLTGAQSSHTGWEYDLSYAVQNNFVLSIVGTNALHLYENSPSVLGLSSDLNGLEMDTAPRRMSALNIRYTISKSIETNLRYSKMGDYFLDPENKAIYEGHELIDISLLWQYSASQNIQFIMKNSLDEAYAERADIAFGEYRYFPGMGRRASIIWSYTF